MNHADDYVIPHVQYNEQTTSSTVFTHLVSLFNNLG